MAAPTVEQLQKALAAAQKKLAAEKKKKKKGAGWTPPFDGAHRGW